MLLIDLEEGRIIGDDELKLSLANAHPIKIGWIAPKFNSRSCQEIGAMPPDPDTLLHRQQAFGYTQEDIRQF